MDTFKRGVFSGSMSGINNTRNGDKHFLVFRDSTSCPHIPRYTLRSKSTSVTFVKYPLRQREPR